VVGRYSASIARKRANTYAVDKTLYEALDLLHALLFYPLLSSYGGLEAKP
jgi:hypothetical protein